MRLIVAGRQFGSEHDDMEYIGTNEHPSTWAGRGGAGGPTVRRWRSRWMELFEYSGTVSTHRHSPLPNAFNGSRFQLGSERAHLELRRIDVSHAVNGWRGRAEQSPVRSRWPRWQCMPSLGRVLRSTHKQMVSPCANEQTPGRRWCRRGQWVSIRVGRP